VTDRITDIGLNESDRELVRLAARVLMALEPGPARVDAAETMVQAYRDDLGEALIGPSADTLEDMALGFAGALLLEMERLSEEPAEPDPDDPAVRERPDIVSPSDRTRVIEALGRYLEKVKPVHRRRPSRWV
jgi:hypothetical protein